MKKRVLGFLKRAPLTARGECNEMQEGTGSHKRQGHERDSNSSDGNKEDMIKEEIKTVMGKTLKVLRPMKNEEKEHVFRESCVNQPSSPEDAEPSHLFNRSEEEEEDDVLDVLGQMVAKHLATRKKALTRNPDSFAHGSELLLSEMEDNSSTLTKPIVLKDDETAMSISTRSLHTLGSHSVAIMSNGSLQPQEEKYFQTSGELSPDIDFVKDVARECMQINNDKQAMEVVRQALMDTESIDLALFCLTTIWVLVRKSDENKRYVLHGIENEETRDDELPFGAIIAAMMKFESAEIQTRACGVIWSLSMNPDDRKDIAQLGGCQAILQGMLMYTDDEPLQVMAMGALKVLSFNVVGRSSLCLISASSVVAASMLNHISNPNVQSEGSAIICNLATGPNKLINPVTEEEINAIVSSIIAHIDSSSIQEGAILALMNLSSSTVNMEIIRRNPKLHKALDLVFAKHPDLVNRDDIRAFVENLRALLE